MPRHGKESSSEIKQINFFTDEEASNFNGTSGAPKSTEQVDPTVPSSGEASVTANTQADTVPDLPDTEIIDFEILPEQSVEPTALESAELTESFDPDTDEEEEEKPVKRPKKRKREPRAPGSLRRESVLLHFFVLVASTVTRIIRNSFFASILTAYDKTAELFRASLLYRFFADKPAGVFKSFKKNVRRVYTDSKIPKALSYLASALLLVKSRIYGLVLLSFGVSAILVHFFVLPYFAFSTYSLYTPVIAIGMIAGSLFLIFSSKTLSGTLSASKIFSAFGFKLLGINKNSLADGDGVELSGSGAIVFGLLVGFLTIVFPLQSILLLILSVIYACVVLKSPEAGLISLFLMAPFATLDTLVGATAIISVSYVFKVLCGKRTLSLEFPDIFVGIFALMLVLGNVITFGTRGSILMGVLFTGIYFITASILRSAIWFRRCLSSVLLIGSVISVYAVITRFLGGTLKFSLDATLETDVGDATAGIIDSISVLSYFVLIFGIFLFAYLLISKSKATRFGLILVNLAAVIYLFSTLPSGAWLAAVSAYIILLILWKSRSAVYLLIISLFLPFLPALNIHSVENFLSSIVSVTARYDLWNAVIHMLIDFGIGGIGLGNGAFTTVYSAYFIGNTENALHAGSLVMQILLSLGIFGFLIFLTIIFFTLQSSFSYGRSCSDKTDFNRIICYAGMCGVIASFIWGINEFIWYNPRLMLLFWLITALTVSARRSALVLETDNKETNLYGDTYLE